MREIRDFLNYVIDRRKLKALVLLCQVFVLAMLVGCRAQAGSDAERYEAEREQLMAEHAAELEAILAKVEAGIYASRYLPDSAQGDILPLARWLGCLEELYPGISPEAKTLACWVVFNRVDSSEYPDDMESVLLQPHQFAEYDPDSLATEQNFTIAANQISRWQNGDIRPCGEGAVFISASSEGVELRDSFEATRYTNYWRA